MKDYNVTLEWHSNTSNAGKVDVLAEQVTLPEAHAAIITRLMQHDTVYAQGEARRIVLFDTELSGELYEYGDMHVRYGDYTIIADEAK